MHIPVSSDAWFVENFPELESIQNPLRPTDAELEFFITRQAETSLHFGGVHRESPDIVDPSVSKGLWPAFKKEFHELVCTDSQKYADIRAAVSERGKASEALILSSISSAVAAVLGVAAAAVVPLAALGLYVVVRFGISIYCASEKHHG